MRTRDEIEENARQGYYDKDVPVENCILDHLESILEVLLDIRDTFYE